MNDSVIRLIALCALVVAAIFVVVFFLRGKLKKIKISAGPISTSVDTHEPEKIKIKDINQESSTGSNKINIKSSNSEMQNISQRSSGDNTLDIGNN